MEKDMFYDDRNLLACFEYESQESSSLVSPEPPVASYSDDFVEKIINEASSSVLAPAPNVVPQFYPQLSSQIYNVCPPNITITTREPIPPIPPPPPPPVRQSTLNTDVSYSIFDVNTQTYAKYNFTSDVWNWMKENDESVKRGTNKSIKELLCTSDIINNQCSSYTKSLYSMKGFARDFQDFRAKLQLTVPDISQRLSHLYGTNLGEKSISDFEDLLLSPEEFQQVGRYLISSFKKVHCSISIRLKLS